MSGSAYGVNINQVLTLDVEATYTTVRQLAAQTSLGLTTSTVSSIKLEQASSALALSQTVGSATILNYGIVEELDITGAASHTLLQQQRPTSVLSLTANVRCNILVVSASNTLDIQSNISYRGPIYVEAESRISLVDNFDDIQDYYDYLGIDNLSDLNDPEVQARVVASNEIQVLARVNMIYGRELTSLLNLTDAAARPIYASAVSYLGFSDSVAKTPYGSALSEFLIVGSVEGHGTKVGWEKIDLEVATTRLLVAGRDCLSTLSLSASTACYIAAVCLQPVVPSYIDPVKRSIVLFEYPPTSPTHTVELRTPALGNRYSFEPRRINRLTRGNTLVIMRDSRWPIKETLTLQFDYITYSKYMQLQEFIKASLGKLVKYTDQDSYTYTVIILTPNTDFSEFQQGIYSGTLQLEVVA